MIPAKSRLTVTKNLSQIALVDSISPSLEQSPKILRNVQRPGNRMAALPYLAGAGSPASSALPCNPRPRLLFLMISVNCSRLCLKHDKTPKRQICFRRSAWMYLANTPGMTAFNRLDWRKASRRQAVRHGSNKA